MDGGFDVWDLIGRLGGETETEEERRRRLGLDTLNAPDEVNVEDLIPFEAEPDPRVLALPEFSGTTAAPETADVLSQYKNWMTSRPRREDYEPGTGRKIAAGLLGFVSGLTGNPAAGAATTAGILEGPRLKAMRQWKEQGEGIGDVAKFAQDVAETRRKRESDIMSFEGVQGRIEAQRSAIQQRTEAENLRHKDRMASLEEDGARRKEVTRHNKALEGLAKESNSIRATEAAARTTSANAYAKHVAESGATKEKPLPAYFRQTVMDEIGQMLAEYPDYKKYFKRNPKKPDEFIVTNPDGGGFFGIGGSKTMAPADADRLRAFIEDAKVRAKRTLRIPIEGEVGNVMEPVDEYGPFRSDIP